MTGPMPGSARALTSLAQTEDKVRRALGLVGDVGVTFDTKLTPVVVASDATAIGSATLRGRRFQGSMIITGGIAVGGGFKALTDLVITQLDIMTGTTGVTWVTRLGQASTADPVTIATPFAPWMERGTSDTDFAPLLRSTFADAAFVSGALVAQGITTAQKISCLSGPVMLTVGQKLFVNFGNILAVNPTWTIYGYVY